MSSLVAICDTLALNGELEARQISCQLALAPSRVEAMLAQLLRMGRVTQLKKVSQTKTACQGCPENSQCSKVVYRLLG